METELKNKMHNRKTRIGKSFFLVVALIFAFSGKVLSSQSYVSSFHKGGIEEKREAVLEAFDAGDASLLVSSLDFCISAHDSLGEDEAFVTLAEITVKSISAIDCTGKERLVSEKLRSLFKVFDDVRIKTAVLKAFSIFPSTENILIVNDFFYSRLQNHSEVDDALLSAILFMGENGNPASFNMLFVADILGAFPEISDVLSESYGSLAEGSEREIAQFLASVPVETKIKIISRLSENDKIPKKICGEAAENALSSVIYNSEGARKDVSHEEVSLVLVCIQAFCESKWTRAASLIPQAFTLLSLEYEKKNITDVEFSAAITDISFAGTKETTLALSSYLDGLNKKCEKGEIPSEKVVLSLIESLGRMGDKIAFDSLFYVTYLDYPESVSEAAKDALSKLKW